MKMILTYGKILFVLSILTILVTLLEIYETEIEAGSEELIILGVIVLIVTSLNIYYTYLISIKKKLNPLDDLDKEIFIIQKKIENRKLLKRLEDLEDNNT